MINMDNFVKSKQIKCICKIINSEMDSCNAIDKHWLKKYDNTFGVVVFFFVSAPILNFRYCIHSKKLSRCYASMAHFIGVMFYEV
jgi:hypothetical protein